ARELRKRAGRPGREIRARQVGAGGTLQHPGGEHDEEVRLKGVPLHLANARHPRLERLARDVEGQPIPDLDAERFLEFGGERHQGLPKVLRGPPAAGDDAVVGPELGRPGEVLLARGEALLAAMHRARRRLKFATPKRHATPTRPRSRPASATSARPASVRARTKTTSAAVKYPKSLASGTTQ